MRIDRAMLRSVAKALRPRQLFSRNLKIIGHSGSLNAEVALERVEASIGQKLFVLAAQKGLQSLRVYGHDNTAPLCRV